MGMSMEMGLGRQSEDGHEDGKERTWVWEQMWQWGGGGEGGGEEEAAGGRRAGDRKGRRKERMM